MLSPGCDPGTETQYVAVAASGGDVIRFNYSLGHLLGSSVEASPHTSAPADGFWSSCTFSGT